MDPLRGHVVGVRDAILREVGIDLIRLPFRFVDCEPTEDAIATGEVVVQAAEILPRADDAGNGAADGEVQWIQLLEVRQRQVLIDHILRAGMQTR